MKKIWITGAEGYIGTALLELLEGIEYQLFPTDIHEVDITRIEDVTQFVHVNRPDVIINCAGLTDVQKCEEDMNEAYRVNAIGVRNVALAANEINAKVIQISTDDVFDKESHIPYARCGSCIHRAGLWNPFDDGKSGNCSCDCDTGVYRYGRCAKCRSGNIGYGTELCRTSNRRYCIKSVDKQKRYR